MKHPAASVNGPLCHVVLSAWQELTTRAGLQGAYLQQAGTHVAARPVYPAAFNQMPQRAGTPTGTFHLLRALLPTCCCVHPLLVSLLAALFVSWSTFPGLAAANVSLLPIWLSEWFSP